MSKNKKIFTSVRIFNDEEPYNLYGVADCLEFIRSKSGISIDESGGKYRICIVEYKPTKPKDKDFNYEDAMQVFAQKVCVDHVFKTDCAAELYYADINKRIKLPFEEKYSEYDSHLREILSQLRYNIERGIIPKKRKSQKCSGCSMKEICMPSSGEPGDVAGRIKRIQQNEITGHDLL